RTSTSRSTVKRLLDAVKEVVRGMKILFGDPRSTKIQGEASELSDEDLIAEEDMVVTISHQGYVKRNPVSLYRAQRRGGRGKAGAGTTDDDFIEQIFVASTHDYVLLFTSNGRVFWLKVHELPQAGRAARGNAIGDLVPSIEDNDELVAVMHANGDEDVIIGTAQGMAIRFDQKEVRPMGRAAFGVKGITLEPGDKVVGAELANPGATLFTMTENGFGKRTAIEEYRLTHRGGKGVIDIKAGERNGNVVAMLQVLDADKVMIITNKGTLIRSRVADVSIIGRNTQGVRVMALSQDGEKV